MVNAPAMSTLICVCLVSVLFMFPSYFNGYPFVFSDTGTYINSGFINKVPDDRPIYYGLFIRHISLATSLWLVVFMQCLLFSAALWSFIQMMLKEIVSTKYIVISYLSISSIILTLTGFPYYLNNMMPDWITVMVLMIGLLIALNKPSSIWIYVFIVWLIYTHLSFILTAGLCCFILVVLSTLIPHLKTYQSISLKLTLCAVSLFLLYPIGNAIWGYGLRYNKANPIFLTATFVDNGLLKKYLLEKEEAKQSYFYAFANNLPPHSSAFLWDSNSPVNKNGGWDVHTESCAQINTAILTSYYVEWVMIALSNTVEQLKLTHIGSDFVSYGEGSPPRQMIEQYYKNELQAFINSKQQSGNVGVDFGSLRKKQDLLILISIFVILAYLTFFSTSNKLAFVGITTLFFILVNAAITANLSVLGARYNGRIIWFTIPVACLMIITWLDKWITKRKEKQQNYAR